MVAVLEHLTTATAQLPAVKAVPEIVAGVAASMTAVQSRTKATAIYLIALHA